MSRVNAHTALGLEQVAFERRAQVFVAAGILSPTDVLIVDAVAGRFGEDRPDVLLGLSFAVRAPRAGHVGVDLESVREHIDDGLVAGAADDAVTPTWPVDRRVWLDQVAGSALVGAADAPARPFVCQTLSDGRRLILTRRLFEEQERAATVIRALSQSAAPDPIPAEVLEAGLETLFGDEPASEAAIAVRTACQRRLTVVTGGPGTGKTYSIKRLLVLLLEHSPSGRPLRVALAAPTGKAATRMAAAMAEDLKALPTTDAVRETLRTLTPRTLHKLLGVRPDGSVRHTAHNPLPDDVIVVDEASMIDLALMRRLLEAVAPTARLILLGDRDQLASVEAGSVLSDLVRPVAVGAPETPLSKSIVRFTRSRRFADAPGIGAVARLLQKGEPGDITAAVGLLLGDRAADGETLPHRLRHLGVANVGLPTAAQLDSLAAPYLDSGHAGVLLRAHHAGRPLTGLDVHAEILAALDAYRVLAVHRKGPLGVSGLERALGRRVQHALAAGLGVAELPSSGAHWLGRVVLVTVNAYDVDLMNGDVGVILPGGPGGQLVAAFPRIDGTGQGVRHVALSRLPPHDGALAMTVHKSQGSQFDHVGLVLAGRESPIETRELVYTGITRAKVRLSWLGSRAELARALGRSVVRTSGLAERI